MHMHNAFEHIMIYTNMDINIHRMYIIILEAVHYIY